MSNFLTLSSLKNYALVMKSVCEENITQIERMSKNQLAKIDYKYNGMTKSDWELNKALWERDLEKIEKRMQELYPIELERMLLR